MDYQISKSAGKVLMAGGYGVLQQNNYGLVLALQNQFYCICLQHSKQSPTTCILVHSPQIQQHWQYSLPSTKKNSIELEQKNNKCNPFVEQAIVWTLNILHQEYYGHVGRIRLLILFDHGFISSQDIVESHSQNFPTYGQNYSKTGLGSSACVLVSIVKCLVRILAPELCQKGKQKYYRAVNVISQIANLCAQKKIGSNFDISTAIYGTHLYKNVLPHKISPLLNNLSKQDIQKFLAIDPEISAFKSTSVGNLYAYIVDIKKGADTRKMVGSFLTELKKHTQEIQQQFFGASKKIALQLFQKINMRKQSQEWSFEQIKSWKLVNQRHRSLQQKYSELTGVPIQPKDLTPLLDKFIGIQSSIYAICPGSGGHDAVFVLSTSNIQQDLFLIAKQHKVRPVFICFDVDNIRQAEREKIETFLQYYQKQKFQF